MQVVVSMIALQQIVGMLPTLYGIAAVLATAPFAVLLGWLMQKVEEALRPKTDKRIDLVTEALDCTTLHIPHPSSTLLSSMFERTICLWLSVHCRVPVSYTHLTLPTTPYV